MNLIEPIVGQELGPQYAFDINNSLTLIDQHNHTPGYGVQIPTAGLNINANLNFNDNFITNLAGMVLTAQISVPATNNTLYEFGDDLYYIDGIGNNIRLTQSGSVAGPYGNISGLVAPASATYVPVQQTFIFESNSNIAANLDAGSILLRNLSPNSTYALTLNPPAALAANYSITLPPLPSSQAVATISTSGVITDAIPDSTLALTATTIGVAANSITRT